MKKNYFFLILLLILSFNSFSQTHTWTGFGGDTNWFNASNWDIGSVPSSFDTTIIPANFFVEIIEDSAFSGIIQLLDNATLSIENNLTLNQSIITSAESTVIWKKGIYKGGLIVNGLFKIESFETKEFDNAFINNYGTINVLNSGIIHFLNEVSIFNSIDAVISIESSGGFLEQGGIATINNEGLIEMPSNEMSRSYYMVFDLNNTGVINVGENQTFLFLVSSQNLNNLETGILEGVGALDITANFTNTGTFSPAGSGTVGMMDVVNNFNFPSEATVEIDIEGTNPSEFDLIRVFGFPILEGNIDVNLEYAPEIDDEFIIITANAITSCNLPEYITATFNGLEYKFLVICNPTNLTLRMVEIVLDIHDYESNNISFFTNPNPAVNFTQFVFPKEILEIYSETYISIFNFIGQEVAQVPITSETVSFNSSNFASGFYFAQLKAENKVLATTKFVMR